MRIQLLILFYNKVINNIPVSLNLQSSLVFHARFTTTDMTLHPTAHSLKSVLKCDGVCKTYFIYCYHSVCCGRSGGPLDKVKYRYPAVVTSYTSLLLILHPGLTLRGVALLCFEKTCNLHVTEDHNCLKYPSTKLRKQTYRYCCKCGDSFHHGYFFDWTQNFTRCFTV